MARFVDRLVDPILIVAISLFVAAGSGSQAWTGFNSPDSEFYASLALHGSDVADRALDPAYTWTRLGYIAPVRLFVTGLDPFVGFWIWRLLLITAVIGSVYAMVRMASTRQLAVIVSIFAGLNTMVLSFVGNTYLTGTVIALTTVLVTVGAWPLLRAPRSGWLPPLVAGIVAAWLVMANPYGLLLGMAMWLALRVAQWAGDRSWRSVVRDGLIGLAAFAVTFGLFILAGAAVFPGRNWLSTYLDWNARLDYASFIGDPNTWQRDIGLLLPIVAIATAVVSYVATRSRASLAGLLVSVASVVFTIAYLLVVPGPWLEAPTYVALLWSGALSGVALAFAGLVGARSLGIAGWVTAAAMLPLILWAGRWDMSLAYGIGAAIALLMVLLVLTAAAVRPRASTLLVGIVTVAAVGGVAIGAQLLQNGRGLLGTYGQFPLRAAFVDFNIESLMRSKVQAQDFVLAKTAPTDRVITWTDADRLTAGIAAMQLWGWYNTVSTSATLAPSEAESLRAARPDAIAMYAPTREQINAFWASLPSDSRPSAPDCTTVPFLGIGSPEAHICVAHLSW